MKILLVGTGGVGEAIAAILKSRDPKGEWLTEMILGDYNEKRAEEVAKKIKDKRFKAIKIDARNKESMIHIMKSEKIDIVMDAATPDFMKNIFDASFEAGCNYQNMGLWSTPDEDDPFNKPFTEEIGEYNFEKDSAWKEKNLMALLGMGIDPGVSDVFARFAADYLFDEIEEIHTKDGNNLEVEGVDVAFGFSIETSFQELSGPNYTWDKEKGFVIGKPFTGEEIFDFPEIGPQKIFYCEHEEVGFMPKYLKHKGLKKCSFKIAMDENLINALKSVVALGLYNPANEDMRIDMDGTMVKPIELIGKTAVNPASLADKMKGKMCVGVLVKGKKDGLNREIFMYQLLDNEDTLRKYGCQVVVAQTGLGAAIGLELMSKNIWKQSGVHAPEAFDSLPFLKLMKEYDFPYGIVERDSEFKREKDLTELDILLA